MPQVLIRCPACGRAAKYESLAMAGRHVLQVLRQGRGLGRGRGFEWSKDPVTVLDLYGLQHSLQQALGQVQHLLAQALAPPPPVCAYCNVHMVGDPGLGRWVCPGCGGVL